jgi:hypothetical protein
MIQEEELRHNLQTLPLNHQMDMRGSRGVYPTVEFVTQDARYRVTLQVHPKYRPLCAVYDRITAYTTFVLWRMYEPYASFLRRVTDGVNAMALRKETSSANGGGSVAHQPCDLLPEGSVLTDYVTQELWEDGTTRSTATIGISYSAGRVLITIRDREQCRVAFTSAETLTAAWSQLREELETDRLAWRRDTFGKQQKQLGRK